MTLLILVVPSPVKLGQYSIVWLEDGRVPFELRLIAGTAFGQCLRRLNRKIWIV